MEIFVKRKVLGTNTKSPSKKYGYKNPQVLTDSERRSYDREVYLMKIYICSINVCSGIVLS